VSPRRLTERLHDILEAAERIAEFTAASAATSFWRTSCANPPSSCSS